MWHQGLSRFLICLSLILLTASAFNAFGCTIVMAARNGLVLAGNNEDRNHPETLVNFFPATDRFFGRIVFGYDDAPFQGGMNDQGLFIDGNALAPTGWQPVPGKPMFRGIVIMVVLGTCATCEDVKDFFEEYNVPGLERARFPIADRTGTSMVVEYGRGAVRFVETDTWYQIATNFVISNFSSGDYPSQRYRAADAVLSGAEELSFGLIREALGKTYQKGRSLTVYSNIYDLKNLTIHTYLLGNFEKAIVMNLDEELEKGQRRHTLASLFEAQPSIGGVLQKYIDALGGKEGLRKIRTRRLTGELIHDFPEENPPKIELLAEVAAAAPDRWRLLLKTTAGAQQMGYDGEHGWLQDSERVAMDDRQARSKLAYLFNPVAAIKLEEYFTPLGLQKQVDKEGREEFVLKARDSAGNPISLYFDIKTGLLNRLGENVAVHEYRKEEGVLHPVTIAISREGGTSTYRFDDIEVNPVIEDSCFAVPNMEDRVRPDPLLFTVEDMQQDFRQLRHILENDHCCLYEYTGKEEFDRIFDEHFKLIDRPMQAEQFFKLTASITAKAGCMHTVLWMPGSFFNTGADNLFPLQIKLIEEKLVVSGCYDGTPEVPVGSIILEINGRTAGDIFDELRTITSADALNPHFIDSQIEKRFAMFYASVFGFPDKYEIIYFLPGKKTRVTADLYPTDIGSVRNVIFANFNHPPLGLEFLEDQSTAVMTIKTFSYYDRVDYFRDFMDDAFLTIKNKGIKNLILDLRENDGGDPFCSVILYSYLERQAAPYFAEPYGKYAELADPIHVAPNHFSGRLFILLDGRCGSTNGHFSALLRYHRIGEFVGTPSGSTYKCNAGSNTEVRLDKTRLILTFGRSTFAAAVEGMDKASPIMPDHPVQVKYQDFLDGKDVFMETALDLLLKLKNI